MQATVKFGFRGVLMQLLSGLTTPKQYTKDSPPAWLSEALRHHDHGSAQPHRLFLPQLTPRGSMQASLSPIMTDFWTPRVSDHPSAMKLPAWLYC